MSKNFFVSSALIASIVEGINLRESTKTALDNLINARILSQTDANLLAEVAAGEGNDVPYFGPENHSPNSSANYTPFNPTASEDTTDTSGVTGGNGSRA